MEIQRYRTANLPDLMDKISKNSIGMDDYLNSFFNFDTTPNYPPYNLIQLNNVESRLEIALAGFSKKEIKVYTEYGRLMVEGNKEDTKDAEYVHRGLAQRDFSRAWTLSEDTEVREVQFKDGLLTVKLGKVVPEHHARKDYL
jgi:HSP20 family molecular chaperone IbpA